MKLRNNIICDCQVGIKQQMVCIERTIQLKLEIFLGMNNSHTLTKLLTEGVQHSGVVMRS